VAVQQAQQIKGITIEWEQRIVAFTGDAKIVINQLVDQYKQLFGQIAVEVSKEATAKFTAQLSETQIPDALK
jgi:hypothetical protein